MGRFSGYPDHPTGRQRRRRVSDSHNRLIAAEDLFRGTLDASAVYPRGVVQSPLSHRAASDPASPAILRLRRNPAGQEFANERSV